MATTKAHTDIEQSKKLKEILPLESADMGLYYSRNPQSARNQMWIGTKAENADIPCWSLSALLNLLPTLDDRNAILCKDIRYDKWHVCYHSTATLSIIDTERYDNPVDAVYEMIIKLNKFNLL